MPAIRDYSFAYESTTTDGGLTLPVCTHEVGDMLVVFLVGDTGTPTVGVSSSSGWFQIFQRVNTCSLTVLAKYVTAAEPDVVVTSTVNETYSGVLVSIRDVYQSYSSGSLPVNSHTTSTGTLIALPTITTTTDNSLVLCVIGTSAPASLSFAESALQSTVMVDGAAEGLGVGWFFKKAAGLTTAYNAAAIAALAGAKAVIEFRAPTGGATVIPAYPAADASILLSPSLPIVYDGTTALAATADSNYGTSIGGRTCNDGTLATVTDVGLDSQAFMSMSGMTNAASATAMSGAEMTVPAAKQAPLSRNILCHFRHPTPIQNQRLSTVPSGRGVWFGMRGVTGGNYKVWQVHGSDAPLVPGYVQPIVINHANTDTVATAGTVSSSTVIGYAFWTGGLGVLTGQSCFGPLWVMDTTTVAGGVEAEPVGIRGIASAAALNKIRFSSLVQGDNQMLCLQAIQFGDGGTNPIYLGLDSTAIEFPSKRNVTKKLVNYNGTDNLIGFTYYPGASDTIIHKASVVSSPSLYHWRIHASASASATYDFNGLSLIGAGDVQLRPVTTFTGMSFTECRTITLNAASVNNCTFTDSTLDIPLAEFEAVENSEFARSSGRYTPAARLSGVGAITLTGQGYTNFDTTSLTLPTSVKAFIPFWDLGQDSYRNVYTPAGTTYLSKVGTVAVVADATAPYGSALRIPATTGSEYVIYELPQTLGTADFCIELRARFPATGANSGMFFRITDSLAVGGVALRTNGPMTQFLSSISGLPSPAAATIPLNTWFHVAVTRSGSTVRLFMDGVLVASGTTGLDNTTYTWLLLGTSPAYSAIVEGFYSDVMVTLGAAKYTANFTPEARLGQRTPLLIEATSGTVDLTVIGGGTPSYTSYGATVNVIAGAVTAELLVTDTAGAPIQNAQVMVAASAGPLPFNATVTIANSGTTATVTHTTHGLATGDKVRVKGASHYQNNGVFTITVTNANTYTYTMLSAPGSNPTGTITSTYVALYGTTDVNGLISMSRVFASNQPVTGWARKSSDAPYYKTGPVSGTINSSTGASLAALLIADA